MTAASATQCDATGELSREPTVRWPEWGEAPGQWIKVPRRLIKGIGDLGLKPHHLWLVLVLQADRYHDRKPRWYWSELAAMAGRDENTIRRWARELQKKKLLRVTRKREPEMTGPRRFRRNYRNEFDLQPFQAALENWRQTPRAER